MIKSVVVILGLLAFQASAQSVETNSSGNDKDNESCNDKCINQTTCFNNFDQLTKVYEHLFAGRLRRAYKMATIQQRKVEKAIDKFNADVAANCEGCRYLAIENKTAAWEIVFNECQCRIANYTSNRPEYVEHIDHDSPQTDDEINAAKEKYCGIYVENANYNCGHFDNMFLITRGCQVLKRFKEQYVEPWIQCLKSLSDTPESTTTSAHNLL